MAKTAAGKGEPNALKHGGASAEKALQSGEEFHGPAAITQAEVHADYEAHGAAAMVQHGAERLESAARLYWDAICAASQGGAGAAVLDGYIARFGWLQSKALLGWAEVKRQEKQGGGKLGDVLDAYKRADKSAGE